jgi:hypothetical protein
VFFRHSARDWPLAMVLASEYGDLNGLLGKLQICPLVSASRNKSSEPIFNISKTLQLCAS